MTIDEARKAYTDAFDAFVRAAPDKLEEARKAMYAAGDALSAAKKDAAKN